MTMDHLASIAHHRFRRGPRPGESGFSLIEVMVAAILVIIVMYGLMQFFVRGRIQVDYEEDRRKATAVAQERIEQLRRWDFAYLISRQARQRYRRRTTRPWLWTDGPTRSAFTVSYDKTVDEFLGRRQGDSVSWNFDRGLQPAPKCPARSP